MRELIGSLAFLLAVAASYGQLSQARLGKVTEYLQGEVDSKHVAGAVALIARHGEVGYFEGVGDGIQKDSLFRIASMTKAITSVAVMMLVEEGKVALDDPVAKHLPEFAGHERQPTIHHLLTHTSGLGYGWFGPDSHG